MVGDDGELIAGHGRVLAATELGLSEVPVIRQPFGAGDALPFWVSGGANVGQHHLYDVSVDPDERENRVGEAAEGTMQELLRTALHDLEAPAEQLQRLGLGLG